MSNELPLLSLPSLCFSVVDEEHYPGYQLVPAVCAQGEAGSQHVSPLGRTQGAKGMAALCDQKGEEDGWLHCQASKILLHRQQVLQSPFQKDQAVWHYCDRLKLSTFGFSKGWFSPSSLIMLDLPELWLKLENLSLHPSTPAHSILMLGRMTVTFGQCMPAHSGVCSAGIYTSIPLTHLQGDICMLWKTSRNKCCRVFYKSVSASTLAR